MQGVGLDLESDNIILWTSRRSSHGKNIYMADLCFFRSDLTASNFEAFSGGECPQTPLAVCLWSHAPTQSLKCLLLPIISQDLLTKKHVHCRHK